MLVTNSKNRLKCQAALKRQTHSKNAADAQCWARRLCARVEEILAAHRSADRDNVRHTLILLEQPPLERLQRS
jgi:hypothetical protein